MEPDFCAGVFLGGAYTLWTWLYGGGVTRRRLVTGSRHGSPSMSLPGTGWNQKAPEATGGHSFTPVAGVSPVAMAAAASSSAGGVGLASAVVSDGERRNARVRKAEGDTLKAQGDYAGAAVAYRDATLSAGVDRMFVEGRVGKLSEGGTELHRRRAEGESKRRAAAQAQVEIEVEAQAEAGAEQQPGAVEMKAAATDGEVGGAAVDVPVAVLAAATAAAAVGEVAGSSSAVKAQQLPQTAVEAQQAATDSGPPMRGRTRAKGLAGYKDSAERRHSTAHTKGTSGGRQGTATAKGVAAHIEATKFTPKKGRRRGGSGTSDSGSEAAADGSTGSSPRNQPKKKKKKVIGRATSKSGGIPRESHRVNVIATNVTIQAICRCL